MRQGWILRYWPTLIKRGVLGFLRDNCATHAAALAYYAVFSLPPLLLIAVAVAGSIADRSTVVGSIYAEVNSTLGQKAAQQVVEALVAAQKSQESGSLLSIFGMIALGLSATGAFNQLQSSLNQIWEVKPDPEQSEIRSFVAKRILSFGIVLGLGFLLMASLLLSAILTSLSNIAYSYLPSGISVAFLYVVSNVVSLVVFAGLFSSMFRMLPDAKVDWRESLFGGLATSFLFTGGKILIGFYLGRSEMSNAYGAAGSLAIILAWTYYASMIVLLGAEFTRAWAQGKGSPVPEPGAMRVKHQEMRVG
ncbi:MAG: YihY/virulence factor BrkB family protein [Bryobacteraceae bacterium]